MSCDDRIGPRLGALLRSCSNRDGRPLGSSRDHRPAGRNVFEVAVVTPSVLRRRLPHDLRESRAKRPERRATHREARVGDRHPLPQQRFGAFDAPGHQVRVRRFSVRSTEFPREMRRRHERRASHRRDVERLRVLAVDEVARPPQMRQISKVLLKRRIAAHVRDRATSCVDSRDPVEPGGWQEGHQNRLRAANTFVATGVPHT